MTVPVVNPTMLIFSLCLSTLARHTAYSYRCCCAVCNLDKNVSRTYMSVNLDWEGDSTMKTTIFLFCSRLLHSSMALHTQMHDLIFKEHNHAKNT